MRSRKYRRAAPRARSFRNPHTLCSDVTQQSGPASTGGEIIVTGGTDLSRGLPNGLILSAPLDATQVNPFTTLLDDVMQIDPRLTESSAISHLDQSLGLPSLFDFTHEDYLDGALQGSGFDAAAFAEDAKIVATANMVVSLLAETQMAPLAANQAIGQLTEPAVAISSVAQGVGPGQSSTFEFTVSPSRPGNRSRRYTSFRREASPRSGRSRVRPKLPWRTSTSRSTSRST